MENNYSELFRMDEDQLLLELPTTLREEVFFYRFGGLLNNIDFLKAYVHTDFAW